MRNTHKAERKEQVSQAQSTSAGTSIAGAANRAGVGHCARACDGVMIVASMLTEAAVIVMVTLDSLTPAAAATAVRIAA